MITKQNVIGLYDDAINQLNHYLNAVDFSIIDQIKFDEFKRQSQELEINVNKGKVDTKLCKLYRYYPNLSYKNTLYDEYTYRDSVNYAFYQIDKNAYLTKQVDGDRIDHLTLERVANVLKVKNKLEQDKLQNFAEDKSHSEEELKSLVDSLNKTVNQAQFANNILSQKYGKVHKSFQQNRKEGHSFFYSLFHTTFFQSRANRAFEKIQHLYDELQVSYKK